MIKLEQLRKSLVSPNFLVIGAMRCATGWIRQCLKEHPDIYMPQKEPHFFDRHYQKGSHWYQETFFKNWKNESAIGEKTATYLHTPEAAQRIHETNPQMKLICSLRDPVDRLFSHYAMINKQSHKKSLLNEITFQSDYVQRSLYYKQLLSFMKYFPIKNIYIAIYEEKDQDPVNFIQKIYRFLKIDDIFKPSSAFIQTKQGIIEHQNYILSRISRFMLHPKSPHIIKKVYKAIRLKGKPIELNNEEYARFAEYFKDDLIALEKLLERDLNQWRSKKLIKP
jgi:hypothetical protein